MKARVKSTGMIVEVNKTVGGDGEWYYKDRAGFPYQEHQLDFDIPSQYDPDYWEKLKHQYAGMAMQGLLSNEKIMCYAQSTKGWDDFISNNALVFAHALVEKMKENEKAMH